jgi:general secretion pathway protein J
MTLSQGCGRKDIAGFTLLEALLATALLAIILSAVATITSQWLPNWNRGIVRVQGDEKLALGLGRVVADVAASEFVPSGRQTLRPLFEGDNQSVTFVRTALAPNAFPSLEIVRIAETGNPRGPELVRTQAPFVPLAEGINDREQPRFADPVVLLHAPYRVSFAYAGADRTWRDNWRGSDELPHAIKVTVRDLTTQRLLSASTATVLHAELPPDCIAAKSLADCLASRSKGENANGAGAGQRP